MKKVLAMTASLAVVVSCAVGGAASATAAGAAVSAASQPAATFQKSGLSPKAQAMVNAIAAKLPADWQARLDKMRAATGLDHNEWLDKVRTALAGDDAACAETEFSKYIGSKFDGVNFDVLDAVAELGGLDVPFVDALFFQTAATPQTFGTNGEYNTTLTHAFRDLQKFWDITSDDIQLVAMNGKQLFADPDRVARSLAFMFNISQEQALPIAHDIIDLIGQDPKLDNGGHVIFSLNAMAVPSFEGPGGVTNPPKLIMGDGLLEVMAGIGLGATAPDGILAHEFGHHVQFQDNLNDDEEDSPAGDRSVELEADAFSAYFLAHARGEALNTSQLLESEKAYFEVGDCQVDRRGHHGTPAQRLASATWAADLANAARPQGHILPSRSFSSTFDAELPDLVGTDAS